MTVKELLEQIIGDLEGPDLDHPVRLSIFDPKTDITREVELEGISWEDDWLCLEGTQ
jgi:hypothetical protein